MWRFSRRYAARIKARYGYHNQYFPRSSCEISAGNRPRGPRAVIDEDQGLLRLPSTYGAEPNTHICPNCLGLPGSLPVLNRRAVEFAVLAAMAIHCEVRETQHFRAEELLLSRSAQGLPDFAVSTSLSPNTAGSRFPTPARNEANRHHSSAHGRRCGKEHSRRLCGFRHAHLRRSESLRHSAG